MRLQRPLFTLFACLLLVACGGDESVGGGDTDVSSDTVVEVDVGEETRICYGGSDCLDGEVCSASWSDCGHCGGGSSDDGAADQACCGQCLPDPCLDKGCSETCECPPGNICGSEEWVCDPGGRCVPTPTNFTCPGFTTCEGLDCGTPCGAGTVCDQSGQCVQSPDLPVDQWCAELLEPCYSSNDCEQGVACTVLTGACDVCPGAESEAVCCGVCEPYDPCAGLACGSGCGVCPPDQTDCAAPPVQMMCDAEGDCSSELESLGCEPHDPCAGQTCGSGCNPCAPWDIEC
ncbi:MAG: hypothetical protein QF464_05550, partial [Myxococcota bacterium]|nr:hypothetical protein [Myxococcota bacterium]